MLVRDDGTRFAFLVSHAAEPVVVKPAVQPDWRLTTLAGEAPGEAAMGPFGVGIFRITQGG